MNWMQKVSGSLGVERLPEMVAMAFETYPGPAYVGNFTLQDSDPGKGRSDHKETYVSSNGDYWVTIEYYFNNPMLKSRINVRVYVESIRPLRSHEGGMQWIGRNFNNIQELYDKISRTGQPIFWPRDDLDAGGFPQKIVQTAYQLIDTFFGPGDDNNGGNDPEFSPQPSTPLGVPV